MKCEGYITLEEQLNSLSIFSLRDLARQSGVLSPTSKKKQQLISEIIAISEGKATPNKSSKQGRPPKVFNYSLNEILTTPSQENGLKTKFVLNQNPKKFTYDGDIKTEIGIVEILPNNSGFLWFYNNLKYNYYFIPNSLILTYGLKYGDKVSAEVALKENQLVVIDIFSINNCPVGKLEPESNFVNLNYVTPNTLIKTSNAELEKMSVMYGQNLYLYGSNNNQNTLSILNFLSSCDDCKKIYINVTVADKNRNYLTNNSDIEMFTTEITENSDIARRVVNQAIERAKRLLEIGEKVIIAVDDVLSISCVDDTNLQTTKLLLSSAKNCEQGSISIFAVMSKENHLAIFEKLADVRLNLD